MVMYRIANPGMMVQFRPWPASFLPTRNDHDYPVAKGKKEIRELIKFADLYFFASHL